jgi:hypothetical protein
MRSTTINFAGKTGYTLISGGYSIYIFFAVKASQGGKPVVPFVIDFGTETSEGGDPSTGPVDIQWSTDAVTVNLPTLLLDDPLAPPVASGMKVGQTLLMQSSDSGTVVSEGPSNAYTVANETDATITCEISFGEEEPVPACKFDVAARSSVEIAPVDQFALIVSTVTRQAGQAVTEAFDSGVLVTGNQTTLTYDIDDGWSGSPPMTSFDKGADLVRLLIQ